jgi:hypothetical protein
MIRFVEGQMELKEMQTLIDGVDQAELAGQDVNGADAAVGNALAAVAEFVMDVARGEHGLVALVELGFVEAPGDAALAVGQFFGYSRFHSKSLAVSGVGKGCYSSNTGKTRKDFEFFMKSRRGGLRTSLVLGLVLCHAWIDGGTGF